ncbi:hypothetical protein F2P81_004175 [Scophthalmus maximus]|uniref:Uncharacterized protein n=1 Tax=Scophthalmus maximus TaxID=52904 RepID=A0A6A4TEI7_SCOMX|nr:hypothetical protein F2P81_004175 [Scophthalmus maximus]
MNSLTATVDHSETNYRATTELYDHTYLSSAISLMERMLWTRANGSSAHLGFTDSAESPALATGHHMMPFSANLKHRVAR